MLGLHALSVGRLIPSSFFLVVFFCWVWVGTCALFDRLDAVKTMAVSMVGFSLIVGLVTMTTPLGRGDMTAFYSLALFPSVIAWVCVYVYTLYIQKSEDVSGRVMNAWFEDREAEQRGRASEAFGPQFAEDLKRSVAQDDGPFGLGNRAAKRASG